LAGLFEARNPVEDRQTAEREAGPVTSIIEVARIQRVGCIVVVTRPSEPHVIAADGLAFGT
jgi:hypothetical protein